MIPKLIHCCWFGGGEKSALIDRCMDSWKKIMPDYSLVVWNEKNTQFDTPFLSAMSKNKQWAFVSDYVRLRVLREYGGIYLDTDIEVVKRFDDLLEDKCFMGFEARNRVNSAVLGAEKNHIFLDRALMLIDSRYESKKSYLIAPEVATRIASLPEIKPDLKVYDPEYFYPYNPYDRERKTTVLMFSDITPNTYAIHHWNKAWKISLHEKLLIKMQGVFDSND